MVINKNKGIFTCERDAKTFEVSMLKRQIFPSLSERACFSSFIIWNAPPVYIG